jgi:hypothetical protein
MKMKKLLFKTMIVLALIVCASFTGCIQDEYPLTVTFKNTTGEKITLISFSKDVKNDIPVIIEPKTETKVFSPFCEGLYFTFLYKERKYDTNTGYAQDYSSYNIVFSENDQHNIECLFKARSIYWGDEIRLLDLEEDHDD